MITVTATSNRKLEQDVHICIDVGKVKGSIGRVFGRTAMHSIFGEFVFVGLGIYLK